MRLTAIALALSLTGCPGAMLLSAAVRERSTGFAHPPNKGDLSSWEGEPQANIETHSRFAMLPREVRRISDGSELWLLRYCPRGVPVSTTDCCMYQFVVRARVVATYQTVGACGVDCSMRPESKVQECINAAMVPDGYH